MLYLESPHTYVLQRKFKPCFHVFHSETMLLKAARFPLFSDEREREKESRRETATRQAEGEMLPPAHTDYGG